MFFVYWFFIDLNSEYFLGFFSFFDCFCLEIYFFVLNNILIHIEINKFVLHLNKCVN